MSISHPIWLRYKDVSPTVLNEMKSLLDGLSLHTVCEEAHCPNQGICFSKGTATFLLMGKICTRNCRFCAIRKGRPLPLDLDEPDNVAKAVNKLRLKHAVITSVTRDDLDDGGARHFARTVNAIRQLNAKSTIELLIPDLQGSRESLATVMETCPEVVNHNVETVPRLYPKVLPKSDYGLSLKVLKEIKHINGRQITKSGIMLGLGEKYSEVVDVMNDLISVGCDALTIGQYLQPSHSHYPLARYVTPGEFEQYRHIGIEIGFCSVASGPFVRSSFNAVDLLNDVKSSTSTDHPG